MHLFIERTIEEVIPKNAPLKFNNIVDRSQKTKFDYTPDNNIGGLNGDINSYRFGEEEIDDIVYDFELEEACYIDIYSAGTFLIEWAVHTTTGFSVEGPWFELKYYDSLTNEWKLFCEEEPAPGLAKAPTAVGTYPLEIDMQGSDSKYTLEIFGEIEEPRFRFGLFNTSGKSVTLHRTESVKASLIIYGVLFFENLIKDILVEFEKRKEKCCIIGLVPRVNELEMIEAEQYQHICCLSAFRDKFLYEFNNHFIPWVFDDFPCYNFGSRFQLNVPDTNLYINDLRVRILKIGLFYLFNLAGRRIGVCPASASNQGTFHFSSSTQPSTAYFLRSDFYQYNIDPNNTVYTNYNTTSSLNPPPRRFFPPLKYLESGGQILESFQFDNRQGSNNATTKGVVPVFIDDSGIYFDFAVIVQNSSFITGTPPAAAYASAYDFGFSIGVIIDKEFDPEDFKYYPYTDKPDTRPKT